MRGKSGYVKAGVTVFCTVAAILLFYDTLFGGKVLQKIGGHLLHALLDNPSASDVLRACSANIEDLRSSLSNFIRDNTPQVAGTEEVDTQPTLGFQRVIQRAIMHV